LSTATELLIEAGDLTPSMKVRLKVVIEKFTDRLSPLASLRTMRERADPTTTDAPG
jgi:hypothetical protein